MNSSKRRILNNSSPLGASFNQPSTYVSPGLVDLHFHGAFGVDLMTASHQDLEHLCKKLGAQGIAAFCPTTVSSPRKALLQTVQRLGSWIRTRTPHPQAALPLGIHLEGPFLHPQACGAHPPRSVRPLQWDELHALWEESQHTLKILTLAPETLSPAQLKKLGAWAQMRDITLSLGHSVASQAQALRAFEAGFTSVTHAWNAMPFHTRNPGVLGAALGRKDISLELIIDQCHLSLEVIRWTRKLHPLSRLCFISDCLSAGGGRPSPHFKTQGVSSLGSQRIQFQAGACRLPNGQLAGGGLLLSQSYPRWLQAEAQAESIPLLELFHHTLLCVTQAPLDALRLPGSILGNRKIQWNFSRSGKIKLIPIDSSAGSR
ncbi:MAG: N-acetylglucosamine-6-phosphate deacetylase [Bdellovibrionia bacterium]